MTLPTHKERWFSMAMALSMAPAFKVAADLASRTAHWSAAARFIAYRRQLPPVEVGLRRFCIVFRVSPMDLSRTGALYLTRQSVLCTAHLRSVDLKMEAQFFRSLPSNQKE